MLADLDKTGEITGLRKNAVPLVFHEPENLAVSMFLIWLVLAPLCIV